MAEYTGEVVPLAGPQPQVGPKEYTGEVVPTPQPQPKKFRFGGSTDADQAANAARVMIGLTETLAAGVGDLANQAYSGTKSLFKASIAKAAGLPFQQTFSEEFEQSYNGVRAKIPYAPETPAGKAISKKLGELLTSGIQYVGDKAYENPYGFSGKAYEIVTGNKIKPSPVTGAAVQAAVTLALLLGGKKATDALPEGAPKPGSLKNVEGDFHAKWQDPAYVAQWAEKNYPETVKNLQASSVGKVRPVGPKGGPAVDAFDKLHQALNEELKIGPDSGQSLSLKFEALMQKMDPQGSVPAADRLKITDAMIKQFDDLNKLANKNLTPEQLVEARLVRPQLTMAETIARQTGVKMPATKEETATRVTDFKAALAEHHGYVIDPSTQIERPLTAGEYLDMQNRARDQKPVTAQDIVARHEVPATDTVKAIVEHMTGQKLSAGITEAEIKSAMAEPSGVWVADKKGQIERQMSTGEYFSMLQDGRAPLSFKYPEKQRMSQGAQLELSPGGKLRTVDDTSATSIPTKSTLNSAAEKVSSGQRFAMTAEERISWDKAQSLAKAFPEEFTKLSQKQIYDKIQDRSWISEAIQKAKEKQKGFDEIAARNKNQDVVNRAKKNREIQQDVLDSLDEQLRNARPDTSSKGQGPKTLAAKGPGKKQAGMLWPEDEQLVKNVTAIKELAAKSPTISAAGLLTDARFNELDKVFNAGRELDPANRSVQVLGKGTDAAVTRLLDVAGPVKAGLEKLGPDGVAAKQRFNLIKGASGASQEVFDRYAGQIFRGLSSEDSVMLDKNIRARRIVAIDKYKGVGKVKHESNTNGAEMEAFRNSLKAKVGAEKFGELDARADKYFRAYQDQLRELHDQGLVSDQSFLAMMNLEYTPTEALRYIDPERQFTFHGKTVTVHDSGIQSLGAGDLGPKRMDSRMLLAEHILRVQTRIKKNEANKALATVANNSPKNGFVQELQVKSWNERGEAQGVSEMPPGWVRVDAMISGKQHPMAMRPDMAEQWVTGHTEMTAEFAKVLQVVSGNALVKTLATTVNPVFALKNIPRDLAQIWFASAEHSSQLPIYALQMGKDMMDVLPDALMRKGRWEDFVREGGSQEYMSQQGPAVIFHDQVQKMTSAWQPVYKGLTFLGSFSESWTRLALRERAIKNGKDSWQASAVAREYMDFSNGGSWTKAVDNVVPYLNAGTQGMYSVAKQAKRDPGRFAWQATQFAGLSAAMTYAAMSTNPEAWKQIPDTAKTNNFVIAPKDMFIIDPMGNKRFVYFKLPLDNSLVPIHTLMMATMERGINGKVPDGITWAGMQGAITQLNGLPVPAFSALVSYASNYDFWRSDAIWKGPKVNAVDEVSAPFSPRPTPEWAKFVGQNTGMSPERLKAAVGQMMPSNFYTDVMGGTFQFWLAGASEYDKAKSTEHIMATLPGVSSVVSLTHPFTAEVDALDKAERDSNSTKGKQHNAISEFIFREANKQGVAKDEFRSWIETQPAEDRDRLVKQFVNHYATDRVFRELKASDGIPSRNWWTATAAADSRVRADVFYQQWVSRSSSDREQMLRVSKAMSRFGVNYWNDEFQREFATEVKKYGQTQR